MKNECSIVRDVLPLYFENMVREETAAFVREHLKTCAECAAELEALKAGKQIDEAAASQNKNDANALVTIKKKIRKKKWIAISITAVCLLAAVKLQNWRISAAGLIAQKHNPYSGKRTRRFTIANITVQKMKNCMACFQDMQPILTIGMMYPLSITLLNFGLHTLMTQRDTFGCIIPMR